MLTQGKILGGQNLRKAKEDMLNKELRVNSIINSRQHGLMKDKTLNM